MFQNYPDDEHCKLFHKNPYSYLSKFKLNSKLIALLTEMLKSENNRITLKKVQEHPWLNEPIDEAAVKRFFRETKKLVVEDYLLDEKN